MLHDRVVLIAHDVAVTLELAHQFKFSRDVLSLCAKQIGETCVVVAVVAICLDLRVRFRDRDDLQRRVRDRTERALLLHLIYTAEATFSR